MAINQTSHLLFAIDGNEANVTQRVGSNQYAFEMLAALELQTRKKSKESAFEILLMNKPRADLPKAREGWQYRIIGPRKLWTQWALPLYLQKHRRRFSAFFTPGHYAPSICPIPYASSVMDLAFETMPETFRWQDRFQLQYFTRLSVRRAHKIVAISQATKRAIQKHYGVRAADIVVAYPGPPKVLTLSKKRLSEILSSYAISEPYFLYVGTIQPRKQIPVLIRGFEQFVTRFQTETLPKHIDPTRLPQLVLVGKTGWLANESLAAISQSSVSALVKRLGYCDKETQTALYSKALATVLVSLEEGFGLPPLEAMANGCLPIVSDSASLPEVVGEAGFIVSPNDPETVAEAMWKTLLLSAKQRATYRKHGREQLKLFSWDSSASVILEVLKKISKKTT